MEKYLPLFIGIIGILGTVIGALTTAFSTEVRTWLETRRQSKRQLKSALFHQKELWGTMFALDKEIHEIFLESMTENLRRLGLPSDLTKSVFGGIPTESFESLEKVKADEMKEVVQKHEETILKLSEIDPLFAYEMSYRSRMHMPEQMRVFIDEINKIPEEQDGVVNEFNTHISHWQQVRLRKKLINSLEKGIIEIAWRIGWKTWWKTKREMTSWRHKIKEDISNEVTDYLSEVVRFSEENHQKITERIVKVLEDKDK